MAWIRHDVPFGSLYIHEGISSQNTPTCFTWWTTSYHLVLRWTGYRTSSSRPRSSGLCLSCMGLVLVTWLAGDCLRPHQLGLLPPAKLRMLKV